MRPGGTALSTRGENFRGRKSRRPRPRVQSTRAHAHRPRTRNADAKRGRNRTNAARGARLRQPQQRPNAGQQRSREGGGPRPRPRRPQRPSAEIPPRKSFYSGRPVQSTRAGRARYPAQAIHAGEPHARSTGPQGGAFFPTGPAICGSSPPGKKNGAFPFSPKSEGCPDKAAKPTRTRCRPARAGARPPPPPLESFRALAYLPRVASNARIFPRSAARLTL